MCAPVCARVRLCTVSLSGCGFCSVSCSSALSLFGGTLTDSIKGCYGNDVSNSLDIVQRRESQDQILPSNYV